MRIATFSVAVSLPVALLLHGATAAYSQEHKSDAPTPKIAWGEAVKGLQLGLAPQAETNASSADVLNSSSVLMEVSLRNTGKSPIRLLASVHTCLLGPGGANALLASELILKPKAGGDPFIMTYEGWNHLSLLDKRRSKSVGPQQTLDDSRGKTDIQLDPEKAKEMTSVLAPGEVRVSHVGFSLGDNKSSWQLKGSTFMPRGRYEMTVVLKIDQELSDWKGELTSGAVEVNLRQPVGK